MKGYDELNKRTKNYINGKISQYMDAYIRRHRVWSPEQMFESFVNEMKEQVRNRRFSISYEDGKPVWSSEEADIWLLSKNGREFVLERMIKKYNRYKEMARRNSPIVERIRFGYKHRDSKFFDISFGLVNGQSYVKLENIKRYPFAAWTIDHVEDELRKKYNVNLVQVLGLLSKSPIEQLFYQHWLCYYYPKRDNPAIIPEVCGFRKGFYYYTYKDRAYSSYRNIPSSAQYYEVRSVNFRYDFFVANTRRGKAALIELDGHEHHKTKRQRVIDSIKRNQATILNIPLIPSLSPRKHFSLIFSIYCSVSY